MIDVAPKRVMFLFSLFLAVSIRFQAFLTVSPVQSYGSLAACVLVNDLNDDQANLLILTS